MATRWKLWVSFGLLLGCAAPQPRPAETAGSAATAAQQLTVSVSLEQIMPDGSRRLVPRGAALRTGDRFGLRVTVDRSAYLSVLLGDGPGATVLYPQAGDGDGRAEAGREVLIPPAGSPLKLDGEPGEEVIYVVVTDRPRSLGETPVKERLAAAAIRLRGAPPPPPPPPPADPGPKGIQERDPRLHTVETASSDERGIAVVRLSLQHE